MSESVIYTSSWSRTVHDDRHPFWWGIMILILIEMIVVIGFLSSFFYLWISHLDSPTSWLIVDPWETSLFYPSINTFLLFLCAASMYYGGVVMDQDKEWHFFWSTVFCCIVGGLALYLRWLQFSRLPFKWNDHAYASFVWTLTGFHFLHLTSAVLGTAVIGLFAARGYYSKDRQLGVKVDTFYWYFVFLAWIPIYLVLYWVPRWSTLT